MPTIDTMLLLGLIVLILVLGPSKLPQFARAIGEAVREFRKASSAISEENIRESIKKEIQGEQSRVQGVQQPSIQTQTAVEVDTSNAIVAAAIKEGIDVRGKTIDQIAEELAKKLREKRAGSTGHI
ncbi:MAG: twin-arginine translocase TatA/TatE family subunit [Desulfurococcales archaeon]|jgi:TatA/E family protein of Tat protein translocase|nr:twin-arginine translocase TatA/TatE family subunit [Desulfurococcales archaeon]